MKSKYSVRIDFLAAAGLLAAGTLNAGVVFSNPNITVNVSGDDLNILVNGTSVVAGTYENNSGAFSYCGNGGDSYVGDFSSVPNFFIGQTTVSAGATISGAAYTTWLSFNDSMSTIFTESGTYYVPFYETGQGVGADQTYYGYLELTYVKAATLTLVGGAIEDSGAAIVTADLASAVPEPATFGAALGVAALAGAAWKRRKSGL